jgi:hypothetical protein
VDECMSSLSAVHLMYAHYTNHSSMRQLTHKKTG